MSVAINIEHAVKKYGDTTVIPDLSVSVKNGEFFTLLGPSGCGKTTLLRMIAGFNTVEGGYFKFNDRIINDMEPGKRDIGMVFQNYAIFPNMTVRKNVEFGLKYKNVPKEQRSKEADKFLKLVHVDQYADRMPERLSGGQQQRVALARALVIKPEVLLMDEPLSNLDAKLRVEMRTVIKNIQKDVGITTVYVTHDQEEAMAVSDRIAVMNKGVIQHCGEPKNIYLRPANLFVATFIGKSNVMEGRLLMKEGVCLLEFPGGYQVEVPAILKKERKNRPVTVSVRPEEFVLEPYSDTKRGQGIIATVQDHVFLGSNTHYFLKMENGETVEAMEESDMDSQIKAGSKVLLTVKEKKINVFDKETTDSLMEGVKNSVSAFPEKQ
ncbi:ABC transporter ATP-binding protein [Blautia sp. Sow4_E7]|uniref:ABC transporter ATP-binding protein n=1 Tax=Blautia sp. Sow4_E7 TaxID=3438749 RepID=UPI003F9395BB